MKRYITKFVESLFSNYENQNELFWQRRVDPLFPYGIRGIEFRRGQIVPFQRAS